MHVKPGSPSWPAELTTIPEPPSDLWLRGRIELLARTPRVAIVGTRAPTAYGIEQSCRFASAFVQRGALVVSGLARGIDSAAHTAALEAEGGTIAVLGCGVDKPWPDGALADRIASHGLLLSEYRPGTRPRRHHFPLRNRLIAGLCEAVLVVEAAYASGSLITARWAIDQGKTVFVLPGRVDQPMARGTLRLMRDGATPVESPEQLWNDHFGDDVAAPQPTAPTDPTLRCLLGETLSANEIATCLGQPIADVLARLAQLELGDHVRRGPGGLYRLA